jgi:hypothetical protein
VSAVTLWNCSPAGRPKDGTPTVQSGIPAVIEGLFGLEDPGAAPGFDASMTVTEVPCTKTRNGDVKTRSLMAPAERGS